MIYIGFLVDTKEFGLMDRFWKERRANEGDNRKCQVEGQSRKDQINILSEGE